jgi:hypothetical protein
MVTEAGIEVRLLRYNELDPAIVDCWETLEDRALEPNAYFSPSFVIPALRSLCSEADGKNTVFIFAGRFNPGAYELVGAGFFVRSSGGIRFPLPHLRAFSSIHSFMSGFLLDRNEGEAAVRAIFNFFRSNNSRWHGLDLPCMPAKGAQAELILRVAHECGCFWHERERTRRAMFLPEKGGETYLQDHLSVRRLKRMRQAWRRLEGKGKVEWRTIFGSEISDSHVESFLDLEHKGWKGEEGTSLRSNPSHEAFFRELMDGFRRKGQLFFTELLLDGAVIASTCNLVSGSAGFAFKIGWNPEYADISPGFLNEVAFVRDVNGPCRDLSYIDSGAEEGSFIEQLWSGHRTLMCGTFSISKAGKAALLFYDCLRRCKVRLRSFRDWLLSNIQTRC